MGSIVEVLERPLTGIEDEVVKKIGEVRKSLGDKVMLLGHHYQRDNIIQFADMTGDSLGLAYAAAKSDAEYIVFCGVHFMAETADMLTKKSQKVILPDLKAGCSMADMANIDQLEECWDELTAATSQKIIPITYVNSTAALKAFCGEHDGTVCTSSNADEALQWALERGDKILFLPDQHLGRNTAYKMGISLDSMVIYNPHRPGGGAKQEEYAKAKIILWHGFCSVHMNFRPQYVDMFREKYPGIKILVHPECTHDVVQKADYCGSTSFILKTIEEAPYGSKWAIGTENHLVDRLRNENPDKFISPLSTYACQCATMYRIDPVHLLKSLNAIKRGESVNQISVPEDIAVNALVALKRMMEITG
jgi:quinolinate synthase